MKTTNLFYILFSLLSLTSCEKWADKKGPEPDLGDRTYCNDPEAVNYNWNFPGQADSTICYFPTDMFAGTFLFTDSVYNDDNTFDSARSLTTYTLEVVPVSKRQFVVLGFCSGGDSLRFTAERTALNASADSTLRDSDTTFGFGQYFCRTLDTLSGSISRLQHDTTNSLLLIDFTVVSDTGINFHRGTAIKQ